MGIGSPDLTARPLGLAEIVDRSIAVTLRHFRALFLAMLLVQAPAMVLASQLSPLTELLSALGDPERAALLLERAGRNLLVLYVSLLALQFVATSAAAAIVARSLDPRHGAARHGRLRVTVAAATSAALQVALLVAAPLGAALPGFLLAVRSEGVAARLAGLGAALMAALVVLLVATLRLMLAPAVAAVEGRLGPAAVARSFRLMAPRPGSRFADRPGVRASLVLLAMLVLAVAVNGLVGIPRLLALRAHGGLGGLSALAAPLPLPLELALSLLEGVGSAALQPFTLVSVAVFYFDRRARTEGLDLEAWAERLEEGA